MRKEYNNLYDIIFIISNIYLKKALTFKNISRLVIDSQFIQISLYNTILKSVNVFFIYNNHSF